jgi:HD-GYP domain-containing protein (c-di-GMP phosphodiesterase class II)
MLLSEQIGRRLQQSLALSEIDMAIISTSDMTVSLEILLLHTTEQLKVDAAGVWFYNPSSQELEFVTGRGFRSHAFDNPKPIQLGEGHAGRAALERRTIHVPNLTMHNDNPRLAKALAVEPFTIYYAVPLIVKEQIKGVLELFHRTELESSEEWLKLLQVFANQAAIAIDNSSLFNDLQYSNTELTRAYDATIQGWSRALDLRDKETEGHTQRVTELTVKLGHQFGLSEKELVHVRRGALLHDIGKMGVPDGILLKPGQLTDKEWIIMRKHPVFAYEMLSPIQYLKPALDIPYCHHEKWDGTGYPRGLSGDQIPFAARLFAIVDVWDALTSDRPYRAAWPVQKVLDNIRSLAGTHFDPQVVKVCLESGLLKGQKRL